MVKWIAEAHGGSVSVRSREGAGSMFLFRIPLEAADETENEEKSEKN